MLKTIVVIGSLFGITQGAWAATCDSGFESFKRTVYEKVRMDCVKCHNGQRPNAPAFAADDPEVSYEHLLNYMNFSKPEESLLVIRSGNSHCGLKSCDAASGEEMLKLTEQWWSDGEKACERNGRFFTAEQELPALPNSTEGFKTLTFDLGAMKAELKGVSIQIDAQNYLEDTTSARGAYRFKSPRLVGGKNPIKIKDVKVLLNGKFDPIFNAFSGIDRTMIFFPVAKAKEKTATPAMSGHTLVLLKDGLPKPKITISFVIVEEGSDDRRCPDEETFTKKLMPTYKTMKCATCHTADGKSMGEKVFDMTKKSEELCAISDRLVDSKYPGLSPLITWPVRGLAGHPQLNEAERYEYSKAVKDWIDNRDPRWISLRR